MLHLILRNFRKRKIKFLANVLIIATGIVMIYSTIVLYLAVSTGIEINENRLGADYMVVPKGTKKLIDDDDMLLTSAPICVYMNKDLVKDIKKIDGVSNIDVQFFAQTLNASCCSVANASRIIGIDASENTLIKAWLSQQIKGELGKDQVIVGSDIPGKDGSLEILGKQYSIKGRLEQTGGALDNAILMDIYSAQKLVKNNLQFKHFWDKYGNPEDLISSIQIKVDLGKEEVVYNALKKIDGFDIIQEKEIYRNVNIQLGTIIKILSGICIITIALSIIQLFAEFSNQSQNRKSEWGLFRALGVDTTRLKLLILGEALIQIFFSCGIGVLGGVFWVSILLKIININQTIPFVMPSILVSIILVILIFIFYLIVAFAASLYPMKESGKIDLATIMMKGDID